jgi:hypothetical protein
MRPEYSPATFEQYRHFLPQFASLFKRIELQNLANLMPPDPQRICHRTRNADYVAGIAELLRK